jgi:hypothetical protein
VVLLQGGSAGSSYWDELQRPKCSFIPNKKQALKLYSQSSVLHAYTDDACYR